MLFDRILEARGIKLDSRQSFLFPDYSKTYDPFLLPDMDKAVERLVEARAKQEKITIYGDYDIDGLTATTLLLDSFESFGFQNINAFIPNRFIEGYGLSIEAIEKIASDKTSLIITVDCGSLSEKEIIKANELGVDVIVTDHHGVASIQPPAIAVINPKRSDNNYPFSDLASVGVAFKLVQALQTRIDGLPVGHEKWLLDLVALGTVCDVVNLVDENRTNVYWGLEVMKKARRPGLKALMAVARVEPDKINARSLGFGLGPRMNAAGRLETAQHSLDMLTENDTMAAFEKAQVLDEMNKSRRLDQDKILKEAIQKAEQSSHDSVLVLSGEKWNHGIVGIVAAKIMERYKKPTIILEEMGNISKGSARSFGDFHIADAIRANDKIIKSGGGHKFAAGLTMPTKNISLLRKSINQYYEARHNLAEQQKLLLPVADVVAKFDEITEEYISLVSQLEPFGYGNPEPIIKSVGLNVVNVRRMGDTGQHLKLVLQDSDSTKMSFVAFSALDSFFVDLGVTVEAMYQPMLNEWQGKKSVEGRLVHIKVTD